MRILDLPALACLAATDSAQGHVWVVDDDGAAGVESLALHAQVLAIDTSATCWLGGASAIVLLDAAF